MSEADVIDSHPLRLLEEQTGLHKAEFGLILARSGVGKSAALINFGLGAVLKDKQVLHFSAGMASEKVHQYYQEIHKKLTDHHPGSGDISWEKVYHQFMVISYSDSRRMVEDLENEIQTLLNNVQIKPHLILVDGLDVDDHAEKNLARLAQIAQSFDIKMLVSMRIHRNADGDIDLEGPLKIARESTEHVYLLEALNGRIHLEFISRDQKKDLPIYFCPNDFIFKLT